MDTYLDLALVALSLIERFARRLVAERTRKFVAEPPLVDAELLLVRIEYPSELSVNVKQERI